MKSDVNGCSTTKAGEEHYELFAVRLNGRRSDRVQYDYRTKGGKLFSCVATSLENARERRDKWLEKLERDTALPASVDNNESIEDYI